MLFSRSRDAPSFNLCRLGRLHALAAVLRRDSFKLLVQRKLLRQRVAQFGTIVDNENIYAYSASIPTPTATRTHSHFACRHQVDKRYHDKGRYSPVAAGRTRSRKT